MYETYNLLIFNVLDYSNIQAETIVARALAINEIKRFGVRITKEKHQNYSLRRSRKDNIGFNFRRSQIKSNDRCLDFYIECLKVILTCLAKRQQCLS